MALPSSGPLSFQDIATELGVNPPLSLAAMSTTAGFTAPFAVTDFYGYSGAAPDVVTNGLVLYLDAGQTSSYSGSGSTWTDLSGYGNNATLVNNPTFSSSYGGNLEFPYSNVYGQINDAASLQFGTGDFTISLWEYPIVVNDGSNQRTILSKNYTGFEIFIYQSILRGYFGGVNQLQGTTTLTANIWYNFVFVRSAGVITSYINTIQDGQYAYGGNVSNIGTGLYINIRPNTPYYGEQDMSNILLYNRALTNSEVVQNYNAFASRFGYTPLPITNGLTLLLDAKNTSSYSGSGINWNDVSGNNNNGTFNVAPTYNAGGYFQLNGTEIVQSFTSNISPAGTSRTVIVWFNLADTNRRGLAGTRNISDGWVFTTNRTAAGNLTYFNLNNGSASVIQVAAGIVPNQWYMGVATFNVSTNVAQLYLNGVLIGTQSSFGTDIYDNYNGSIATEQNNDFTEAFAGGYSIVNIYNRVLTPSEIIFNYNAYASRFGLTPIGIVTSGLILELDASNPSSYSGSGTTWTDLSGNGNDMTMVGTVPFAGSGQTKYFSYNGTFNYFQGVNNFTSNISNAITISVVVNITNISQRSALFSKYIGGVGNPNYVFEAGFSNSIRWYVNGTPIGQSDYRGNQSINQNQNYLLTLTYNSSTGANALYINSTQISASQYGTNSTASNWSQGNTPFLTGNYGGDASSLNAYMNEYMMLVYNKALTPAEVAQNYYVLQSRFGL